MRPLTLLCLFSVFAGGVGGCTLPAMPTVQRGETTVLYQEGCVLYITAESASVAEELTRDWDIRPDCEIKVNTKTDQAD